MGLPHSLSLNVRVRVFAEFLCSFPPLSPSPSRSRSLALYTHIHTQALPLGVCPSGSHSSALSALRVQLETATRLWCVAAPASCSGHTENYKWADAGKNCRPAAAGLNAQFLFSFFVFRIRAYFFFAPLRATSFSILPSIRPEHTYPFRFYHLISLPPPPLCSHFAFIRWYLAFVISFSHVFSSNSLLIPSHLFVTSSQDCCSQRISAILFHHHLFSQSWCNSGIFYFILIIQQKY